MAISKKCLEKCPKTIDKLGGASKRLCEMIIQSFAKKIAEGHARDIPDMHTDSNTFLTGEDDRQIRKKYTLIPPEHPKTEFVAVRFGNELS